MEPATLAEFEQEKARFQQLVDERVGYTTQRFSREEKRRIDAVSGLVTQARRSLSYLEQLHGATEATPTDYLTELMDNLAEAIGEAEKILRQ